MASPLSPLNQQQLNSRTPATVVREDKMSTNSVAATPCRTSTPPKQTQEESIINWDDEDTGSSPFVAEADSRAASNKFDQVQVDPEVDAIFEDPQDPSETQFFETSDNKASTFSFSSVGEKENTAAPEPDNIDAQSQDENKHKTPEKASTPEPTRKSMSPLKPKSTIKKRRSSTFEEDAAAMPPPSTRKTLRFNSPLKTKSPTKQLDFASETPLPHSREPSFEKADENIDDSVMIHDVDETGVDDTCFSTFSAVPDMTMFAKLGDRRSPLKQSIQRTPQSEQATPRPIRSRASDERSPSPTPRRPRTPGTAQSNTTNLIDFTQQIERFADASSHHNVQQTPSRRSPQKSATEPNLLSYLNQQRSPNKGARMSTPAKSTSLLNLLDFELPPAPTPRSIPTITVRELESMKSQYQSQISSLKATLSGREAEVDSLKKAVGDAERRVGEALENLREEKGQREQIEHEKNQWEQRGVEFEQLLQNVKQEVMRSDEEKEILIRRAEEAERLTEKQQNRADEAESKILDLEAQLATARAAIPKNDGSGNTIDEAQIQHLVQQQIDAKVEAVSRELHAVYKKKHETKVATLKKSYEARGEKKCAELQTRLDELLKQNEELTAAASNNIESSMMFTADDRRVMEEANSTIEEQRAHLANLDRQLQVMRTEHSSLIAELEKERIEKGELVAAVDEMLLLQSSAPEGNTAAIEDFRRSISRPAPPPHASIPAFREQAAPVGPGSAQSRIGRGVPRPSGIASKSKMMSNIERMGGAPKH